MTTVNELFEDVQDNGGLRLKYFGEVIDTLMQVTIEEVTRNENGNIEMKPEVDVYNGQYINSILTELLTFREDVRPLVIEKPEVSYAVITHMLDTVTALRQDLTSGIIYEGKGSWNPHTTQTLLTELGYECNNNLVLQESQIKINKLYVLLEKIFEDVNRKNRQTKIKHVIDIKLYVSLHALERNLLDLIELLEDQF